MFRTQNLSQSILAAICLMGMSACDTVGEYTGIPDADQGDMTQTSDMSAKDMPTSPDMSAEVDMSSTDMQDTVCQPRPKTEACMGVCGTQPDGCNGSYDCGAPLTNEDVCEDACGAQPDGCGGTIECAPCECINGQPSQAQCGPCNLGAASCDGDNTLSCNTPAIPDIETLNCDLDIIHVANDHEGSELGTREAPFVSLQDGMAAAAANGSRVVLLRGDGVYEEGPFTLTSGISIVGGFDSNWLYTPTSNPTLKTPPPQEGEDSIGVLAENITQPTTLLNLRIETSNAPIARSSYGLIAQTANRLVVRDCAITPGKGGVGENGVNGTNGLDGISGAAGLPGQEDPGVPFGAYNCPPSPEQESLGGLVIIPTHCQLTERFGGIGGEGGCTSSTPNDGDSYSSIQGGTAGTNTSKAGGFGNEGVNPMSRPGSEGVGGLRGHSIENARWISSGVGQNGTPGSTGFGGTGGGGAYHQESPYSSGPSGGNGGGGGCGGNAGRGGGPGGASIGILAVESLGLSIVSTTITSSSGGTGGKGGNGGLGGRGGDGGEGTYESCTVTDPLIATDSQDDYRYNSCQNLSYKSGDGGDGEDGQMGGPGGGGAGGDSVGVYCHNSNVSIDPGAEILAGDAGEAGSGGTYPNNSKGFDGEAGISAATVGCD